MTGKRDLGPDDPKPTVEATDKLLKALRREHPERDPLKAADSQSPQG